MAFDIERFRARFVEEAREHINKLTEGLLNLEKDPSDQQTVDAIFRSAHTIKGSSKMVKLIRVADVAHRMEDVLGALRENKISHSKPLADLLFKGIDAISNLVDDIAAGREMTADNRALSDALRRASEGVFQTDDSDKGSAVPYGHTSSCDAVKKEDSLEGTIKKIKSDKTIRVNAEKLDELIKLMGEIISNQGRLKQRLSEVKALEKTAHRKLEIFSDFERGIAMIDDAESHKVMNEFVMEVRSFRQKTAGLYRSLKDDVNVQELLNNELQEKALMMRMVPLSTVFDTLHRLPRDLSDTLGKQVDLVIEGGDIELDKKIVERIADPLVHMLRNSIDHGIETSAERRKAGKPERGTIKLSARYEAGNVLIELSDDGAGIPIKKIREKALRIKLLDAERPEIPSDSEIIELIFHPGFSTSEIITELSGRGVGMDVVRRNIVEELKGSIKVETDEGKGTCFHIRLPLSLSIMRLLLITVSETTIALPTHYISEILNVLENDLIPVVDKKAIRLRGELVPVTDIAALLNLPSAGRTKKDKSLIIVVMMGNEKLGLVADALLDEKDGVIKPFPSHLRNIKLISGVIISGNNEVINVIHVPAIIESSKRIKRMETGGSQEEEAVPLHILVVDDSLNTREIEKGILESYGYKVSLAEDGQDAIEKASDFNYDLVITDIEMPRLDGFSLTERLRKNAAYKNVPIIIVTSREKEEDKRRGIRVGADAYIIKGTFDQTNLLDTVRNLVGQP